MNTLALPAIALRLWGWAAMVRVLKQVVPLETLVRFMRRPPTGRPRSRAFERKLENYLDQTARFPFRPPANCFERSLAVYRILCSANTRPELVVGFRHSPERRLEGHVWVVVDGRALGESSESLATFTPIVSFDADARPLISPPGYAMLPGLRFT